MFDLEKGLGMDNTEFVGSILYVDSKAVLNTSLIRDDWGEAYSGFFDKFGSFGVDALRYKTGKVDAQGNSMRVWQDYVAGTDPTDPTSTFKATITIEDGVPKVKYDPELPEAQKSLRTYTTYGCVDLSTGDWVDVSDKTDAERAGYNFFKVSVEMK